MKAKLILCRLPGAPSPGSFPWDGALEEIVGVLDCHEPEPRQELRLQAGGETLFQGKAQPPEAFQKIEYDYCILLGAEQAATIEWFPVLVERGIPYQCILSWEYYRTHFRGKPFYLPMLEGKLAAQLGRIGCRSLLDADGFFLASDSFTMQHRLGQPDENIAIDLCLPEGEEAPPIYRNVYRRRLHGLQEAVLREYDAVLLAEERDARSFLDAFWDTYCLSGTAIVLARASSGFRELLSAGEFTEYVERVEYLSVLHWDIFLVQKMPDRSFCGYVITHKDYPIPRKDGPFRAIHAGRQGDPSVRRLGDDTGDSISHLNPMLNELTALYWIWKNTCNYYVGIEHYHRYFLQEDGELLTEKRAKELLRDCDILLAQEFRFPSSNDINLLRRAGDPGQYPAVRAIVRGCLGKHWPDYLPAFDRVISGKGMYRCNMLVTRWPVLDRYCSWIFPFLLEAVPKLRALDLGSMGKDAKRLPGYFGEMLLTVWLSRQRLAIRELPIRELDHNDPRKRIRTYSRMKEM